MTRSEWDRRFCTYEDWLAEESAYANEIADPPPYVPPPVFGRPKGWQPSVEYGFGEW